MKIRAPKKVSQTEIEDVSLEMRFEPAQSRAKATIEQIIVATAELLEEIGFERLSTNLICQSAGLTPPALYRYFPNKYAILHEMGRRLMAAEDAVVIAWLTSGVGDRIQSVEKQVTIQMELARKLREAARSQPGGVWILRVMRAVPILREVREQSTAEVTEAIFRRLEGVWPNVESSRLRSAAILSIALTTSTNELILDDPALEESISSEFARMVALYFNDLLRP